MNSADIPDRRIHPALLFALLFGSLLLIHAPLLGLPYFWDEAGYYIPAARDLLLTGSVIPRSTPSNAHPPLVMAYLALCWKIARYTPVVTRIGMLLVAAFSLLGVFRLAETVANVKVAAASTLCVALYPVFFAQSTLAQVDLAAAGLTFWGFLAYLQNRRIATVLWFSLAVLAKETALVTPLAILGRELLCMAWPKAGSVSWRVPARSGWNSVLLLAPLFPLGLWYAYHRSRTGFVFGNPEFFRYNVQATVHPLRIVLALLMRLWQVAGYMNLYPLTLAALAAMWLPPLAAEQTADTGRSEFALSENRDGFLPRIAVSVQLVFLAVIAAHVVALSVIGGAVLARYMLPAVPLGIIVCVSTLYRRVRLWPVVVGIAALAMIAGLFVNPPYGFSLEDNLAYRDYILLHEGAETFLEARYPMARVLTAWPASGEISQPWIGYVTRPMRVLQIENFTVDELMPAAERRSDFEVALVFSTKYEPRHSLLENWRWWQRIKAEFFGYHRDVPPAAAAQILGGRLVYTETCKGQWVGVIEMEQVEEARVPQASPAGKIGPRTPVVLATSE